MLGGSWVGEKLSSASKLLGQACGEQMKCKMVETFAHGRGDRAASSIKLYNIAAY